MFDYLSDLFGKSEDARSQLLRQTAFNLEMNFREKEEYGLVALLGDFKLFNVGGRKKITNLLTKDLGLLNERINIFDYQYTVSSGKSSYTYRQTVFFMQSKKLAMPEILMKPETFFHKLGQWFGMQDINFEEFPVFSKNYLLQGEDEQRIRHLMGNRNVLRFFTTEKDWSLEGIGYFMIFYLNNKLILPNQIQLLYHKGMSLYEQFKTEDF